MFAPIAVASLKLNATSPTSALKNACSVDAPHTVAIRRLVRVAKPLFAFRAFGGCIVHGFATFRTCRVAVIKRGVCQWGIPTISSLLFPLQTCSFVGTVLFIYTIYIYILGPPVVLCYLVFFCFSGGGVPPLK